ncbi:Quinone oxidoreductase-like protein 1 [Oryzias melastigma]|uniref:Quinone oxidoreductase-like protein 1 n=1 Tax=Oryzias melastigma TaxID=30732 RepID=A0A834FND9_ORYME|nr:Quinone oxidoreductase-like protein 1 [Oryzias melastigma]
MKGLFCRVEEGETEPKFIIQETTLPEVLGSHQVRVQVKACGLRPLDLKLLRDVGVQTDLVPVGREVAGVVLKVGPKVTFFQPEDEVVGILPLDSSCSGLCEVIDVDECVLVGKPEKLSAACAAATLRDGVRAYTALHTHAGIAGGHTLLVIDGSSVSTIQSSAKVEKDSSELVSCFLQNFGLMCIQLAAYCGLKVLATSSSAEEQAFLEQLRPAVGLQEPLVARVIPVFSGSSDLLSVVLEETGGLGVDAVIDSGVCLFIEEKQLEEKFLPDKHDIISMLSVGGQWVTSHQDLQLDPPDCRLLFLKSASVSFLNPEVWTTSSAQQGRYLHILKDVVEKMSTGVLRPQPQEAVPLYEAVVVMETIQRQPGKTAVVQL